MPHLQEVQIHSRSTAKREFPRRLLQIARQAHGYDDEDDTGINADIARQVGVTRGAVTRWMQGTVPRIETLLKIAKAYGVTPDYLVGNTPDDAQPEAFALDLLADQRSYANLVRVLRIMAEMRDSMPGVSKDQFVTAIVDVLQRLDNDPTMSDDAIIALGYRLLRPSN